MIPCQLYTIVGQTAPTVLLRDARLRARFVGPEHPRTAGRDYVAMLVEPVLTPVRRVVPPIGGLDIAFLIVIIVDPGLSRWLMQQGYSCLY